MYGTFFQVAAFNQYVGGWGTFRVATMEGMFSEAAVFNLDVDR